MTTDLLPPVTIRQAEDRDLPAIREIFLACYGKHYAYPAYYDVEQLKKLLYSDDNLLLVAEDAGSGQILGTASVLLQIGAYADLVGEFGRLAVHPDSQGRGLGKLLMEGRLERVRERLHVGLVEPRVNHPFSQKIAVHHGFAPIGLLPMNQQFARRESSLVCARYFCDSLQLRRNHPHIIPELFPLGEMVLANCGLPPDLVVDSHAAPYPNEEEFELDELTAEGYAALLRLERGRVSKREIFGPMRLHYGMFKLRARHSTYLLARSQGQIVGAVGCLVDELDRAVRIFELISLSDRPIRFLLCQVLRRCREQWQARYVEADVSAYAPRMQRTLLELGFLPSAYVPAMVFHRVERLDVARMSQLLVPTDFNNVEPIEETRALVELVVGSFTYAAVLPEVVQAAGRMPLLAELTDEQARCLASICHLETFQPGETIVEQGQCGRLVYLVLRGSIAITAGGSDRRLARLEAGSCLGERALLQRQPHSATARALDEVAAAVMSHEQWMDLVRRRPDIGVILYRNLAAGLSDKLRQTDELLAGELLTGESSPEVA